MPNQSRPHRYRLTAAQRNEEFRDYHEQMLLEAIITAGAVVAVADGWVEPEERLELAAFVQRHDLLSTKVSSDVSDGLDTHLRQFEQPGGMSAAVSSLQLIAGSKRARLVVEAAEHVAAADGCVPISELQAIALVRGTIMPPSRLAIAARPRTSWR